MSGKTMTPLCPKCGKYPFKLVSHDCPAKETRSGSPLESVVQGRPESPAPSNPDRSGDANILAELRARAEAEKKRAWQALKSEESKGGREWACYYDGKRDGYIAVLQWLDELSEANQQHSTRHEVG